MTDSATDYAQRVLTGEIVAGPHVRDACRRHLRDLENTAPDWPYRYDRKKVEEVYDFIENKASLGIDQPFILLPWQKFVVGCVFGWVKKATGYRRFRTCYVETAKGSGKTPLGAVIGLWMMCNDGEAKAECYVGAATKEQANIGFKDLVSAVKGSPLLRQHVILKGGETNEWGARFTSASGDIRTYRKVAFDTAHSGLRPHYVHIDELHEHPDASLITMLRAGFKSRPQPLLMVTTNTAFDEFGVCQDYKVRGIRASAGESDDDSYFAFVASMDEDDLVDDRYLTDQTLWPKTNPGLPALPGAEYINEQISFAKGIPTDMAEMKRLAFCHATHEVDALISRELWTQAENDDLRLADFEGQDVYLGLDLAHRDDFSALTLAFRTPFETVQNGLKSIGYNYTIFIEQWTPRAGLKDRAKRDRAPYPLWGEQGHIHIVEGPTIGMNWIAHRIDEIRDKFNVQVLAYDSYAFKTLKRDLEDYKVAIPMVSHPQGFSWSAAAQAKSRGRVERDPLMDLSMPSSTNELIMALKEGRVATPANPMSRFNVQCSKARISVNGDKVFVRKNYTSRVDGLVAAAMAVGAAKAKPHNAPRSSYVLDDDLVGI